MKNKINIDTNYRFNIKNNRYSDITIISPQIFLNELDVDPKKLRLLLNLCSSECNITIKLNNDGERLAAKILESKAEFEMIQTENKDNICLTRIGFVIITSDVLEHSQKYPEIQNMCLKALLNKHPLIPISREFFLEKIEDNLFISEYFNSLHNLIEYKMLFYRNELSGLKKIFETTKNRFEKLKDLGVSEKIDKHSNILETYAFAIVDMEYLIDTLKNNQKHLTHGQVKYSLTQAITNKKKGLDSLIGRENVKSNILSLLYSFSKSYKVMINSFNNYCIMGKPGIGKTAIAKVISYIFSTIGILATDNIFTVTRADIVAGYIGQTAMKTKELLYKSLEGILFIDEAYQLASRSGKDYGREAITEIVNFSDKYIGMQVLIVAGYEKQMKKNFLPSNDGLERRFPKQFVLKNYTKEELTDILIENINLKLQNKSYEMKSFILEIMNKIYHENGNNCFKKQAGDMLNLSDLIVKHAICDEENIGPSIIRGFKEYLENG